jgi:hypothetical protein
MYEKIKETFNYECLGRWSQFGTLRALVTDSL